MKINILLYRKYKTAKGKEYESFHVLLENKLVWINKSDFINHNNLLIIDLYNKEKIINNKNFTNKIYGTILLKEPPEKYYFLEKKRNNKGSFLVLKPKKIKTNTIVQEPVTEYLVSNESIKKEKIEIIEINAIPTLTNKKKTNKPKNSKIDNFNKESKFIIDLIDYTIKNNLNYSLRSRITKLVGNEIEKKAISEDILKRLKKLEDSILKDKKIPKNLIKDNKSDKTEKLKIHNPKKIVDWLKLFTIKNTAIKYSTHIWDQDDLFSNYSEFISRLNDEFVKYKFDEMSNYNSNLYWNKIYPFLFQKKLTSIQKDKQKFGWGRHKIKIGWQYPDILKKWTVEHPNKQPFFMELPDEIKPDGLITGKTIKYFEDVVSLFKKEIEFRHNDLYFNFNVLLSRILPKHQINKKQLESLKGINFYTNTEYVVKAIERIFQMIKSRSASTKVEIKGSYCDKNKEYIIEILHINSYSDKPINDPKIMQEVNNGDIGILITTLMSLCDFSIESRFKNNNNKYENYRIDYLYNDVNDNDWKPQKTVIDKVSGFKYLLKFPAI